MSQNSQARRTVNPEVTSYQRTTPDTSPTETAPAPGTEFGLESIVGASESIREALEHARRPDTDDRVLPFPPRRHRDADPLAS